MPGLDAELDPKADHGETSYRGTGRLPGRKALITGGDSGIGAAVAIAFAREGADVALSYLPEEQVDADAIAGARARGGSDGGAAARGHPGPRVLPLAWSPTPWRASAGSTSW